MAKPRTSTPVVGVCPHCGAPPDWRDRLAAGGRKSHAKMWPKAVALAKRLRRPNSRGKQLSYRAISARLAQAGHLNERGQPFNPQSVRAMIEGPQRRK